MKKGALLPIGTHIKIGHDPDITGCAYDLVCELTRPIVWEDKSYILDAKIIEDPNGWSMSSINHSIRLQYDTVVSEANKDMKLSLERMDD